MYRQCKANRRAWQAASIARSNQVPTSRSLATRRSQSAGMVCNSTLSGWYAHARISVGVGSTGLAKPRNAACCKLTAYSRVSGRLALLVVHADALALFQRDVGSSGMWVPAGCGDTVACHLYSAEVLTRVRSRASARWFGLIKELPDMRNRWDPMAAPTADDVLAG